MSVYQIQKITQQNETLFLSLLQENSLPFQDIDMEKNLFWCIKSQDQIIGGVGLELYSPVGLLRSLVVQDNFRNQGVAAKLWAEVLNHARKHQLHSLFLLTTTADRYFLKQGWKQIEKNTAPKSIQQSTEFSSVCPDSAICMKYEIKYE